MKGTIEPPKRDAGCAGLAIILFFVLFAVASIFWSLICPFYEYKGEGGVISFEHWFFNKSSVKGKMTEYPYGQENIFKGSWKANRLILTFQDGGKSEVAIIADSGVIFFRGETFTGERVYFNIPFLPGA